jgi:hypothetical protein
MLLDKGKEEPTLVRLLAVDHVRSVFQANVMSALSPP